MPFDAIALVLIASIMHAGWNVLLHETPDREAAMAVSGLVIGIAMIPLIWIWPPWEVWPLIILSGIAQSAYGILLAAAYQRGMLGVSYPIARGTAPLLVTLGGWLVLSQQPGPTSLIGAVFLGIGLVTIARAGARTRQGAAVVFALLTGVAIASYQVIDASAVQSVTPTGYLGAVFLVQGILITVWIRGTRRLPHTSAHRSRLSRLTGDSMAHLRGSLRTGTLIGIGSTAAYMLVVFALQRADAGRVSTLREISILLGLVISRQPFGKATWIGATFVVAGALLAAF